jgi:PAS domain S-box-containing protein
LPNPFANVPHARLRATSAGIVLIGALVMLALWLVVASSIRNAREAAIDHARAEVHNLATTFADAVGRNLDGITAAMNVIAQRLQAGGDPSDVSVWVREIPILSLATIRVGIIGPDGHLLATTLDPHPEAVDLRDREHVRVQLEGRSRGIFISKPIVGRTSAEIRLHITRRVDDANGRLIDIIDFSLSPGRVTGLTEVLELGRDGVVALVGSDNVIRARFTRDAPDGLSRVGESLPNQYTAPRQMRAATEIFFTDRSPIDGIKRLIALRHVSNYPLAVVAGRSTAEILAAPRAEQKMLVATAGVATLLVAGLCCYVIWEIHTRARHADRLAADEAELRAAREILQDAVDSISEAFVIFDRDDRLVLCNEPFRRLYDERAVILATGRRFADIVHDAVRSGIYPEAVGREREWIDERLAAHRELSGAVEQRLSDGRFLMTTERRMRNGGTAGLRVDVSRLKETEIQLRQLTDNLNRIQRIAGLGSIEVNLDAERIEWSAEACEIFGVDPAEVEPSFDYLRSFIHPDDLAAANEAAAQAQASRIAPPPLEYRIIRPDGAERVVYRENAIKYDANGRAVARTVIYKDITELKAKEVQFRRAIDQLDRVQRIAGIGHTTMDLTTGLFEWSAGACAIFGVELASVEPSVEYFRRFVHPDDKAKVQAAAEQAALSGDPAPPLEYRIVRPDGAVRTVYRENAVEHDASGRPLRRIVTFKDITEVKATEARLRETMDILERAQRLAHTGSDARDLATDDAEWSDESYRIFGVDKNEFVPTTENFLLRVLPEDREIILATREQIAGGVCPEPFEYRICRPDGEVRHLYRETEIIRDENGKPVRIVGTLHDVTEARAAEARLRETMENLQRAQRIAHMGSIVLDLATDRAEFSDEMYRILGVDRETFDTATENFIRLIVPEDRGKLLQAREQYSKGICPEPYEYRIRRPDSEIRHIYRETELIYDASGRPIRMVGTLHDVTEARAAASKQRELQKQLQHSQKLEALGTLAGGIAHELNNALMPISSLSKMLLEALPPDGEDREALDLIIEASGRARNLVQSILSFSRKQDRLKERIDLADLVRRSLQMLRATLPATVRIDEKISPAPPVLADADELNQVVVNLVTNAAHAVGAAVGAVTVGLAAVESAKTGVQNAEDGWVRLWVADNGCGMDAQTLERIFEPFFTTKEVGQGTGLGLSVVHGIVSDHGGRIEVKSEPGKGTRLTIYLPVDAIAAGASERATAALAAA